MSSPAGNDSSEENTQKLRRDYRQDHELHRQSDFSPSPPSLERQSNDIQGHHAEITLTQRMLSASIGNFFTSVLGTAQCTTLIDLPPNLGITTCCREVFWVGNTSPFCIAEIPVTPAHSLAPERTRACVVEASQRNSFTSTFDGLRKIARNEGALALWRGLSPTLVMGVPANVIYFTGYDWLRLDPRSPFYNYVPDSYAPLICGSAARTLAATSISPIEMFRTRLQATSGHSGQKGHFNDTLRGLWRLTQTHGYTALWRGLPLTLWRDVPFSGMYWFGYEWMRNTLTDWRARSFQSSLLRPRESTGEHHNLSVRQAEQSEQTGAATFVDSFVSGAVSGSIAALITTPFDIGKTRQQVFEQGIHLSARRQPQASLFDLSNAVVTKSLSELRPEQLSMPKFLVHIFREEGVAGLLRGWFPRCLKVAPSCGIMISSYEICKRLARQYNERNSDEDVEL
ncbi:hypothetical protein KEM54_004768 [Ascosphaera aggregata]|nr:hypothetical protein KEM54_004768 [Ascosphaera aggregata]